METSNLGKTSHMSKWLWGVMFLPPSSSRWMCFTPSNESTWQSQLYFVEMLLLFCQKVSWKLRFVLVERKEWGGNPPPPHWECLEKKLLLMPATMWRQWWALFSCHTNAAAEEMSQNEEGSERKRKGKKVFLFLSTWLLKRKKWKSSGCDQ